MNGQKTAYDVVAAFPQRRLVKRRLAKVNSRGKCMCPLGVLAHEAGVPFETLLTHTHDTRLIEEAVEKRFGMTRMQQVGLLTAYDGYGRDWALRYLEEHCS